MQLAFDFTAQPPKGELVFVRHRWARRYILRVQDDGRVRVTLPRWGTKRDAQAFVERSHDWIAAQLRKHRERPPLQIPGLTGARTRAAEQLPGELLGLARRLGIDVTRVSVRNQRSRWGACSSTGQITLNWRLVLVPDFVREYVMIDRKSTRLNSSH